MMISDPVFGEVSGSVSAKQLPTITAKWAKIQALSSNAAAVYVGASGVTIPDGTTDTTSGFALVAGADTGWFPTTNLNRYYIIGTNATDDIVYWVLN